MDIDKMQKQIDELNRYKPMLESMHQEYQRNLDPARRAALAGPEITDELREEIYKPLPDSKEKKKADAEAQRAKDEEARLNREHQAAAAAAGGPDDGSGPEGKRAPGAPSPEQLRGTAGPGPARTVASAVDQAGSGKPPLPGTAGGAPKDESDSKDGADRDGSEAEDAHADERDGSDV